MLSDKKVSDFGIKKIIAGVSLLPGRDSEGCGWCLVLPLLPLPLPLKLSPYATDWSASEVYPLAGLADVQNGSHRIQTSEL